MSEERTRKERFLPWRWEKLGLNVFVTSVVLDGKTPVIADGERHLIELDVPWETCTLDVQVAVARPGLVTELLGPAARADVVLALRCDDTRWRWGERVTLGSSERVRTSIQVERRLLSGVVELQATLVAPEGVPAGAHIPHARVAGSRPWVLRVDRTRELSGVYLDVRYRSFKADETIPEARRAALWQLDLDTDAPILWLNADYPEIVHVLDAKGYVGARAALRDVAFDAVVPQVWAQLFVHAAETWRKQGEAGAGWQDAVLDAVAMLLFDTVPTDVARERLEHLLRDDGLAEALSLMQSALQIDHDAARHLERLVNEVAS